VGDFFNSDAEFLQYTDRATELIGWLRGKTYVLALLRDIQLTNCLSVLAVIHAVLTQWTAHYHAYRRLLEIRLSLQILVENDEKLELRKQQLLLGNASARKRSWKNIMVIKNSAFWHALARYAYVYIWKGPNSPRSNLCIESKIFSNPLPLLQTSCKLTVLALTSFQSRSHFCILDI